MKMNKIILCIFLLAGCATWAEENNDIIFLGTVEKIYISALEHSNLNWVVQCRVDKVISGKFEGKSFSFRIHSPSQSSLKVGEQYKIEAKWIGDGYTVDELQWAERALNKIMNPIEK